MMGYYPMQRLGEALRLDIDEVSVLPGESYEFAGVYSFGRGLFSRGAISGEGTSYAKLNRLREGRIVVSRLKAFEGAIGLVGREFDGSFLSPEFPTFSALAEVDIRYVGLLARWPDFWGLLSKESKGVGARRERVNAQRFLDIKVPLPNRDEQQRIADKVWALLGRLDAVHELRSTFSRVHASLAESLISQAAKGVVETVRLGEVVAFERSPVAVDLDATYRVIGVRSFGKGLIYHPPSEGKNLSKLNYFQFPADALVLSNLMAWEGGITVTTPRDSGYIASNRFFFYVPVDGRVNVSYLRHYLLSSRGQVLISSACSSGAERNRTLGRARFEALKVPLPPRPEQDRVARILDSLAERVHDVRANPALEALRPSILNAAFTGQL